MREHGSGCLTWTYLHTFQDLLLVHFMVTCVHNDTSLGILCLHGTNGDPEDSLSSSTSIATGN